MTEISDETLLLDEAALTDSIEIDETETSNDEETETSTEIMTTITDLEDFLALLVMIRLILNTDWDHLAMEDIPAFSDRHTDTLDSHHLDSDTLDLDRLDLDTLDLDHLDTDIPALDLDLDRLGLDILDLLSDLLMDTLRILHTPLTLRTLRTPLTLRSDLTLTRPVMINLISDRPTMELDLMEDIPSILELLRTVIPDSEDINSILEDSHTLTIAAEA